ncbi:hypothetical protein HMPREF1981_02315 [Bacteroides pyogenes F0041]|uniref:Uncharacterized protein n=1 Tax=Bacteroides pyogenes F0041 TaxID=1321819 RepID=U2CK81_9BACE|nr:hypothetical protein HMPREF1981_02315 [Bacteroides pyogenes F0041]GAE22300.1 hypothetical protein JCM10003_1879 [Bacteroides pyogenes JCM 10003]
MIRLMRSFKSFYVPISFKISKPRSASSRLSQSPPPLVPNISVFDFKARRVFFKARRVFLRVRYVLDFLFHHLLCIQTAVVSNILCYFAEYL